MESAESSSSGSYHHRSSAGLSALRGRIRDSVVVLQVDGAVTGVHGMSWLADLRDGMTLRRLAGLQVAAMSEGWSHADFDRARLAIIRPRRAEVNALGKAYLAALSPGAADAAQRMCRAGVAVELSGEVGIEAMFGVADALGVSLDDIHAPHLRFDALGSFVGAEAGRLSSVAARGLALADRPARAWVGTHASELLADPERDLFLRFTGVVAHEGPARGETVGSFAELAELVVG